VRTLSILAFAALLLAEGPDYEEFGKGFLKDHGNAKAASDLPWDKLRSDWCVHVRLGAVDVAHPIAYLNEKPRVMGFETDAAMFHERFSFEFLIT